MAHHSTTTLNAFNLGRLNGAFAFCIIIMLPYCTCKVTFNVTISALESIVLFMLNLFMDF